MRKVKVFYLLLFVTIIAVSCNKDEKEFKVSMKFTVDGTTLTMDDVVGQSHYGAVCSITGQLSGAARIGMTLSDFEEGSFDFSSSSIGLPTVSYFSTSGQDYAAWDKGNITITEHDVTNKRVKGTFHFTGYDNVLNPTDEVSVTNGVFSCEYQ